MTDKRSGNFEEEQLGTVARCGSCGAIFRNVPWVQGMTCPRCKSVDFKPVPIIHGALDYTLADRSGGFTAEDVRVGTQQPREFGRYVFIVSCVSEFVQHCAHPLLVRFDVAEHPHVAVSIDCRAVGVLIFPFLLLYCLIKGITLI